MRDYRNNDATQLVEEKFFRYNFEELEFPGKEDMEKLNTVTNFFDYVSAYAKKCGYAEDTQDIGKLASFLAAKCKEAEVNISRQTLMNWLSSGMPANTASGRENVYRLCFALRMNGYQTREFFLKAYLERPFNYKNIHEAVYFFCMNNGLTYSDAVRIISEIESKDIVPNPYADNITEQIGERLSAIKTEEELMSYIAENRSGFTIQNQTATNKIAQLIEDCKVIAVEEYNIFNRWRNDENDGIDDIPVIDKIDNIDELLNVIYGYAARAKESAKSVYEKSISKSNFPELIKQNWPQREQFEQILKKKNASYDVIRRALIMLSFYDFAANATVNQALESGIFDEFTDEMNTILSECGYVQLYWRNPFDWMIGYCAQAPDPLGTLRSLIAEYYICPLLGE